MAVIFPADPVHLAIFISTHILRVTVGKIPRYANPDIPHKVSVGVTAELSFSSFVQQRKIQFSHPDVVFTGRSYCDKVYHVGIRNSQTGSYPHREKRFTVKFKISLLLIAGNFEIDFFRNSGVLDQAFKTEFQRRYRRTLNGETAGFYGYIHIVAAQIIRRFIGVFEQPFAVGDFFEMIFGEFNRLPPKQVLFVFKNNIRIQCFRRHKPLKNEFDLCGTAGRYDFGRNLCRNQFLHILEILVRDHHFPGRSRRGRLFNNICPLGIVKR